MSEKMNIVAVNDGRTLYPGASAPENREYNMFIGPNHPGIEGNFALKLTLEGDTIVQARTDAGYLHRGFEKLMEQRLYMQNIAIVPRICVPDPDPNEKLRPRNRGHRAYRSAAPSAVYPGHDAGAFENREPPLRIRRLRGNAGALYDAELVNFRPRQDFGAVRSIDRGTDLSHLYHPGWSSPRFARGFCPASKRHAFLYRIEIARVRQSFV